MEKPVRPRLTWNGKGTERRLKELTTKLIAEALEEVRQVREEG